MDPAHMAIYGHRHLGFIFRKVLEIGPDGFIYKNKHYTWKDIVKIKRYFDDDLIGVVTYSSLVPSALIKLNDGTRICIFGRVLEKKDAKFEVGFLSGKSNDYDELLSLLEEKWKTSA